MANLMSRLMFSDMPEPASAMLRGWMNLPSGLALVTGPTGSGKSTTLYAALSAVDDRRRKIITVEDPVEHQIGRAHV